MAKKKKQAETNVILLGQDCMCEPGLNITPEECEAVARVFIAAAKAIRDGAHGRVFCHPKNHELVLAEIGIDQGNGFKFDEENGLPALKEISFEEDQRGG